MYSIRQEKVSRELQRELGDIFERYDFGFKKKLLITITKVRISADLSVAKVYLGVMPSNESEYAVKIVNQYKKNLRYLLGKRIRNQMKEIPDVFFYNDDSLDYIDRIDELLKQ